MARLGVTYQDIANAANQLVAQSKQPTIDQIRNLLGTGSATTIANHLRKWRAEQDGSMSVAQKENLPQEFVSVMKGLWQRLQGYADQQIVTHQQASELTLQQVQQEVDKYKTNNQRWQKMHEMWMKEKEELTQDKLKMQEAKIALQKDNAALVAKGEAETKRIEELQRLHKLAQENLEHYRESMRVQRLIDQEKHAQQLKQLDAALKNTEKQLMITNQEKLSLQNQLEEVNIECINLKKKNEDINDKYDKLQITYKTSQHEVSHLTKQHDVLQEKFDEQYLLLVDEQKHNAVISQQLTAISDAVKELKEQNKLLAREKWEIAQEKAQLEGQLKQMAL